MAEDALKNIVFYELCKGSGDLAKFSKYARFALDDGDYADILTDALSHDSIPANATSVNRPEPIDKNRDWSLMAEDGRNLYAIRLTNDGKDGAEASTSSYFPGFLAPVYCLAEYCPPFKAYISQVERHIVPGLDDATWATFVVDQVAIRNSAEVKQMDLTGGRHHLNLPIYLNLFDRASNLPVWMAAHHAHDVQTSRHHDDDDHHHEKAFDNHGGIHPPTLVNLHGGIHPPSFVNSVYINLSA